MDSGVGTHANMDHAVAVFLAPVPQVGSGRDVGARGADDEVNLGAMWPIQKADGSVTNVMIAGVWAQVTEVVLRRRARAASS